MTAKKGAGALDQRVTFSQPQNGSDGLGGVLSGYVDRFERSAGYTHLRGGESVMAARLSGRHVQVIRVRRDAAVLGVTTAWRVRDSRTDVIFNIREISPVERSYLDFTCESGVAT